MKKIKLKPFQLINSLRVPTRMPKIIVWITKYAWKEVDDLKLWMNIPTHKIKGISILSRFTSMSRESI